MTPRTRRELNASLARRRRASLRPCSSDRGWSSSARRARRRRRLHPASARRARGTRGCSAWPCPRRPRRRRRESPAARRCARSSGSRRAAATRASCRRAWSGGSRVRSSSTSRFAARLSTPTTTSEIGRSKLAAIRCASSLCGSSCTANTRTPLLATPPYHPGYSVPAALPCFCRRARASARSRSLPTPAKYAIAATDRMAKQTMNPASAWRRAPVATATSAATSPAPTLAATTAIIGVAGRSSPSRTPTTATPAVGTIHAAAAATRERSIRPWHRTPPLPTGQHSLLVGNRPRKITSSWSPRPHDRRRRRAPSLRPGSTP